MSEQRIVVSPGGRLAGRMRVPGDKSISHRAVMLGAIAEGHTRVQGFLDGADCLATRDAFRAMGVTIKQPDATMLEIEGVGMQGLQAPPAAIDLGNSGTSMRLLAGLLAGQSFDSELVGDASLMRRPMLRVVEPLRGMGARIDCAQEGRAPLRIYGGARLQAVTYEMPVASAQVKSCVLLAGLYADGETTVTEPGPSRDHTERMLRAFGCAVHSESNRVSLRGGGRLLGGEVNVPGDLSSAAFALIGASLLPGSDLLIEGVGVNPTRAGILEILRRMGADISEHRRRDYGDEPVADLQVRTAQLRGIDIPPELVPLAIDEFPAILVAAACAEGQTRLRGAAELRVKESDRIAVMAEGLRRLGIAAEATEDGMLIEGGRPQGGEIDSHGDHRIAMAFAMAGMVAQSPVTIHDCANVATSFPGFVSLMQDHGARMEGMVAA